MLGGLEISRLRVRGRAHAVGERDLAIRYGFDRYRPAIMALVVLLLFVLVTGTQPSGDRLVHWLRRYR